MSSLTRAFAGDLEVGTGRTIVGIIVPFDRVARVSDDGRRAYNESFTRGAFTRTIAERGSRVRLLSQHARTSNPLGRATLLREDSTGVYGEFVVSKTQAGDEALELVRDGALDSFSIGFAPISHRQDKGVTVRTEVRLNEASLVTFPAYEDARVASVRSADRPSLTIARRRLEVARLRLTDKDNEPHEQDREVPRGRRGDPQPRGHRVPRPHRRRDDSV